MNKDLIRLSLNRCIELGDEIFKHHQNLMKWKDPKLTDIERTQVSLNLQSCLESQNSWLRSIIEEIEED